MEPRLPIILVVDDEQDALDALCAALRRRLDRDYRIVGHVSAGAALEELARSRDVGESVALIIADQWMPELPGVELLGRAREIEPEAKRALLVAWDDRSAGPTVLEGCRRRRRCRRHLRLPAPRRALTGFTILNDLPRSPSSFDLYRLAVEERSMSPMIRGALKHAVFLGFVSAALLSAAAFGGDGCSPAGASPDHQAYDTPSSDRNTAATFT